MKNRSYPSTVATAAETPAKRAAPWIGIAAVLLASLLWAYWPVAFNLAREWQGDEDYSVGQLVPLVAIYLAWRERAALRKLPLEPCGWGLGLMGLALAARLHGILFLYESTERYSMVLMVAGVVLLVAGRQVFRQVIWILLMLFLMVPLPGRVHNLISGPLQSAATVGSVFLLDVFGVTVTREGNVILLNHSIPLGVAEACSGLRMLTAFIVVSATLAYLVNRPPWQKAMLLVSSIPVAIACNMARIWVTAELYLVASSKTAEWFFHDVAGLAMMPVAVLILLGELWLMKKLVIPDDPAPPAKAKGRGVAAGK